MMKKIRPLQINLNGKRLPEQAAFFFTIGLFDNLNVHDSQKSTLGASFF